MHKALLWVVSMNKKLKREVIILSTKQTNFQLNGEDYGMDIATVSTVEKDLKIKKIVSSSNKDVSKNEDSLKNIKGKVDLRGEEIPVYSLRSKFGFPEKEVDLDTRYLVTNVDGKNIAFEVDHVKGISDIEDTNIYKVPSIIKNKETFYIKSLADLAGELVIILDSSKILNDEEKKVLQGQVKN